MKHVPLILKLSYALAQLLTLSGCGDATASPSKPIDDGSALAIIVITDADVSTFTPALPDDLGNTTGSSVPTGAAPPARVAETPVVYFYDYPYGKLYNVERFKVEAAEMRDFKFRAAVVDAWLSRQSGVYPHFRWRAGDKWAEYHGWTTPDEFRAAYKRTLEGAAPDGHDTQVPNRSGAVSYPIRGGWWSGCSDWRHLAQGQHAGHFDRNWLAGLSWAELQSLHSDDHEGRVQWRYVVRPPKAKPTVQYYQTCPLGGT